MFPTNNAAGGFQPPNTYQATTTNATPQQQQLLQLLGTLTGTSVAPTGHSNTTGYNNQFSGVMAPSSYPQNMTYHGTATSNYLPQQGAPTLLQQGATQQETQLDLLNKLVASLQQSNPTQPQATQPQATQPSQTNLLAQLTQILPLLTQQQQTNIATPSPHKNGSAANPLVQQNETVSQLLSQLQNAAGSGGDSIGSSSNSKRQRSEETTTTNDTTKDVETSSVAKVSLGEGSSVLVDVCKQVESINGNVRLASIAKFVDSILAAEAIRMATLLCIGYEKETGKLVEDFEQERNAPGGFVAEEKRLKLLLGTNKKDLESSFTVVRFRNVEKYTKELNELVEKDNKKKEALNAKKDLLRSQYETAFHDRYKPEYIRFGNKDIPDVIEPALSLLNERMSDGDKVEKKALTPQLLLIELVSWSSNVESELGASIEQCAEGRKHLSDVLSEAKEQLMSRLKGQNETNENGGDENNTM